MKGVQHTPGPWTLRECSNGGMLLIRGEQLGRHSHVQSMLQILPSEDARLIAAAPELLAALKTAVKALDYEGFGTDELRDVIDKAEGR